MLCSRFALRIGLHGVPHTVMARKRKKRKNRTYSKTARAIHLAFDYGCLPTAMAVANLDFPTLLTEAQVDAVAYGTRHSKELNEEVPAISLVAQHAAPLAKAFSIFQDWSISSDSDAVELTFLLRDAGGYILVISPEPARMEQRCIGYNRTHQAVNTAAMWCKPIDTFNPILSRFKDHYTSVPIAPYIFTGETYTGPRSAFRRVSPAGLHEVSGLHALLKFEVTFVAEHEAIPGTIGWLAAKIESSSNIQTGPRRHIPTPDEISGCRLRTLSRHFPVTLERMRVSREIRDSIHDLQQEKIQPWQVEQAICNLVLESDLSSGKVRGRSEMHERIIEALDERYELADGSSLPPFDAERIRRQVLADGNELLSHMQAKRAQNLSSLQTSLQTLSLLESKSAAVQE